MKKFFIQIRAVFIGSGEILDVCTGILSIGSRMLLIKVSSGFFWRFMQCKACHNVRVHFLFTSLVIAPKIKYRHSHYPSMADETGEHECSTIGTVVYARTGEVGY
jgi:hypothetical protein